MVQILFHLVILRFQHRAIHQKHRLKEFQVSVKKKTNIYEQKKSRQMYLPV